MNIITAVKNRHSVRKYKDIIIEKDIIDEIKEEIKKINEKENLNFKVFTEEPEAFNSFTAHYGRFRNVKNYIAFISKESDNLDEKVGFFGEHITLKLTQLGLNSCWTAVSYKKRKVKQVLKEGEKLVCVLAFGYGENNGHPHRSKKFEDVVNVIGEVPDWFKKGIELVLLAPSALNQQKFRFTLNGSKVKGETTGIYFTKIDLGIAKYHFEIGAGKDNFEWE